jgi:hypothetical protein
MIFNRSNRIIGSNIKRLEKLEKDLLRLNQENKEFLKIIEEKGAQYIDIIKERENALKKIISEKSKGFPWLAEAIAEFYWYKDYEIENYLKSKKHPALKKAEEIREISLENRLLRKKIKIAQYFVSYYEKLFPWITEYVGENLDEQLEAVSQNQQQTDEDENDPVLIYIPRAEYEKLPPVERNQKALDRYRASRKNSYQIGRDYERYIGYLYEMQGYKVEYVGIEKGLEDLGRDLICSKDDETEIVQCKHWASHKIIHEKHINQLYGTAVKYFIDHQEANRREKEETLFPYLVNMGEIKASFITSTKLSDTAKKFARALSITVIENNPLMDYPVIKCNIAANGDKIYHLPFDQQYDKTLIRDQGEFYAMTVKEAEENGFRRALRWRGSAENGV